MVIKRPCSPISGRVLRLGAIAAIKPPGRYLALVLVDDFMRPGPRKAAATKVSINASDFIEIILYNCCHRVTPGHVSKCLRSSRANDCAQFHQKPGLLSLLPKGEARLSPFLRRLENLLFSTTSMPESERSAQRIVPKLSSKSSLQMMTMRALYPHSPKTNSKMSRMRSGRRRLRLQTMRMKI